MIDSFRTGLRDLAPLLPELLDGETVAALRTAADSADADVRVPDVVWARTLWQAAAAHHHGVIHRDHVVQALVPLYLGRAGAFLLENTGSEAGRTAERLEDLCRAMEDTKPEVLRRWAPENER